MRGCSGTGEYEAKKKKKKKKIHSILTTKNKTTPLALGLLPLFHQSISSAGSEPEPSFKPVLCLSTPKAPAPNQEKRFASSSDGSVLNDSFILNKSLL